MCSKGGGRVVDLSRHPFEMAAYPQVCIWHVRCGFFAGGSLYDLMSNYGISHTDVMESMWHVEHAVNNLPEFRIEYPSSVDEQRRIAADFERVSGVGFNNCAGAIDGVLIWIQ